MSGGEWERVTGFESGGEILQEVSRKGAFVEGKTVFLLSIFGIRGKRSCDE